MRVFNFFTRRGMLFITRPELSRHAAGFSHGYIRARGESGERSMRTHPGRYRDPGRRARPARRPKPRESVNGHGNCTCRQNSKRLPSGVSEDFRAPLPASAEPRMPWWQGPRGTRAQHNNFMRACDSKIRSNSRLHLLSLDLDRRSPPHLLSTCLLLP